MSEYHKCLLCPCKIRKTEIYCSNCSWEVSATRENAQHGGKDKKSWDKLWAKIQSELEKRKE